MTATFDLDFSRVAAFAVIAMERAHARVERVERAAEQALEQWRHGVIQTSEAKRPVSRSRR